MQTIVKVRFGSHLYGTDTPDSDLDEKAVHIPSAKDIILQRPTNTASTQRAKQPGEKNYAGENDIESYSLQKYLDLLAHGQTVGIDMLFAPPQCILEGSALWQEIWENKQRLLTKKSAAFVGYCRKQANKYGVKGSRVAAAKLAMEMFEKHYIRLGATARVHEIAGHLLSLCTDEHTKIIEQVCNRDGDIGTYFECCNRKVDFKASIKQAYEIFQRIYNEYGHRARQALLNEGIDWKALSHAVRVGHEALELLNTSNITFPLPNAAHLIDIKQGRLKYVEVAEEIEGLLVQVEQAAETSSLPDSVDHKFIEDMIYDVYGNAVLSLKFKEAGPRHYV